MKRALILIFAAVLFAGPAGSFAASLGGIGGTLGAGAASVAACDAGFGTNYTTVSGNVTAVEVTGIAAACVGGALSVTLTNGAGTAIGSGGPVTVSGTNATASISSTPDGDLVAGIRISIEGP